MAIEEKINWANIYCKYCGKSMRNPSPEERLLAAIFGIDRRRAVCMKCSVAESRK
jgi:hypothetical protein